jgi:DNA-binding PadR family transcriptional regulator
VKILKENGLIKKGYKDDKGREYTRYSITEEGKIVFSYVDGIMMDETSCEIQYPTNIRFIPMEMGFNSFKIRGERDGKE